MRFDLIFLAAFFLSSYTSAQVLIQTDSSFKLNSTNLTTNYNKILNLHNFSSVLSSNYELGKFSFSINNRFNSNVIFSTIKNIRDENYLDIKSQYKINKLIRPGLSIESKRINDNRKVGISRFKDLALKIWLTSNVFRSFQLSPFYGYKEEEQFEIYESGDTYGLESFFNEHISSSKIKGSFRILNDYLSIRKNKSINSELYAENFLSDNLLSFTRFYFNKIERDYFTSIDTLSARLFNIDYNIENRADNVFDLTQKFELINPENIEFNLSGSVFYRFVEKNLKYKNFSEPSKNLFDNEVKELKLSLSGEIRIPIGKLNSTFRFLYFERSEKHSVKRIQSIPDFYYYQRLDEELQKNNFSSRTTLVTLNKINLFSRDTISLEASISKLKYDTPPLESFSNPAVIIRDDRDELLYIIRLQYLKYFNQNLTTLVMLESFNNHLVYIFKERSSNNNWNRVLRLASNTTYHSKSFSTKNYFEVLANYTIYDFEDLFQTTQSFAFRQFGFNDSTKIFISPRFFFAINYNLKLSEQGVFFWRRFSAIPGRYLNEQSGEVKFGNVLSKFSFVSFGIRFSSFTESNFKGKDKQIVFEMKSAGPLVEGYLYYRNDFYLNLKCWIENIVQRNQPKKRNINLSFNSHLAF